MVICREDDNSCPQSKFYSEMFGFYLVRVKVGMLRHVDEEGYGNFALTRNGLGKLNNVTHWMSLPSGEL
jgi:hypothetical protein